MIRARHLAVLTAVLVLSSACSGDDPAPPDPDESTSSAAAPPAPAGPEVVTDAKIRKVTGRLKPAAKRQVRTQVTETVDDWFESAFLGGDYPRTDFDDAFSVFTRGAQARALADRTLMSNSSVGRTTYQVRAKSRLVRIDVLANRGRPAGVTVKFRLGMARIGDTGFERDEVVAGYLYLTRAPREGWQVFGYDVQRGDNG